MRKIVAGFASSLDGFIEGPNGEYDWILIDKEIDFEEYMKRFDTFFYGRRSYEMMLPMSAKPAPGITNYVFSNTLKVAAPNFNLISGNISEAVNTLKKSEGKDIAVWGGATLLASLLNLKLVDEISISLIPVMLGQGKPMVDVLNEKVWLTLVSSKSYSNGTVQLTYTVGRKPSSKEKREKKNSQA